MQALYVSILIAAAAAPAAAKGPMDLVIGNTVEANYGKHGSVRFMFKRDSTYSMILPNGSKASGDWIADDRYFCTIQTNPKAPSSSRCERNLTAGKKLGLAWKQVDSNGENAVITVTRGQ